MKCPTCGHDPDNIQQKRAAVSRWSVMTKKEKSEEMSRIRRKGIKKPKRVVRRSNDIITHVAASKPPSPPDSKRPDSPHDIPPPTP